jgi:hypothetical protein
MAVFGVTVEHEDGMDFYAVSAECGSDAQVFVAEVLFNVGTATFHVDSLENLIDS